MSSYLYRGFGVGAYDTVKAALTPKSPGKFEYVFNFDGSITHDGSASYGNNVLNAVHRHQLNQLGNPTAGISTTPHKERAIFYALAAGKYKEGMVIVIDRNRLAEHNIVEYVVASTVANPSVPEDNEIILVGPTGGALDLAIVVAVEMI